MRRPPAPQLKAAAACSAGRWVESARRSTSRAAALWEGPWRVRRRRPGFYTAAELAGSIKAKDELVLEFRLEATDGGRPPVARTAKAKAKADGEDLLTPLVERAADVIATAVMK
jgi:hypothetical protein